MPRYIDIEPYERQENWDTRVTLVIGNDVSIKSIPVYSIPTADVRENKPGHWIQEEKCSPQEDDSDYYFLCSNCGHSDIHNVMVKVPFCWFCGAIMDGDE